MICTLRKTILLLSFLVILLLLSFLPSNTYFNDQLGIYSQGHAFEEGKVLVSNELLRKLKERRDSVEAERTINVEEHVELQGVIDDTGQVEASVNKGGTVTSVKQDDIPVTSVKPVPSEINDIIEERMKRIKDVCNKHGNPNKNTFHLFHFGEFGLSWLPLYKAGSTNWKKFFIDQVYPEKAAKNDYGLGAIWERLLKPKENKGMSDGRRRTFDREAKDSIRFTVIRHPLSRLVSHFRKTVTTKDQLQALNDMWVKQTILLARRDSVEGVKRKGYELELDRWLRGQLTPSEDNQNPLLAVPTFPEFISWVLAARKKRDWKGTNDHWTPASTWADPCQNDFNIVIKLENETTEMPYLLQRLNMTGHLEYFLGKHNSSGAKEVKNTEVEECMKQLSENQQREINKIYEMDYEMFGYDPIYVH